MARLLEHESDAARDVGGFQRLLDAEGVARVDLEAPVMIATWFSRLMQHLHGVWR